MRYIEHSDRTGQWASTVTEAETLTRMMDLCLCRSCARREHQCEGFCACPTLRCSDAQQQFSQARGKAQGEREWYEAVYLPSMQERATEVINALLPEGLTVSWGPVERTAMTPANAIATTAPKEEVAAITDGCPRAEGRPDE